MPSMTEVGCARLGWRRCQRSCVVSRCGAPKWGVWSSVMPGEPLVDELVGADLAQSEQVVAGREDVKVHDVRVVRAREPQHGEMWRTTLASSADAEQVLE